MSSEVSSFMGIPIIQHPAVPDDQIIFGQTSGTRSRTSFTERALQEAIAKLRQDNPENPRYMMIAPKQMAMLRNVRWNEPEPTITPEQLGDSMFKLLEQEEAKWQTFFARQYV